ncbi:hypothetical protein P7H15_10950 [Paenibacillus larvae]|nr:hypothetical protein [Paenibacillus larvae]MDT2293254.1 hypothetical protein [Paenibacillus larvae]
MSKSAESVTVLERLKSGRASINEVRQEFDLTELGDKEEAEAGYLIYAT